jgi:heme oxygenase
MQMDDLKELSQAEKEAALFLQKIKKSTNELHVLLESNSLLSAIISPEVTIKQYYCYLILMHKIMEVYEKQILTQMKIIYPRYEQREASQLIAEDIQSIGYILPQDVTIKDYFLPGEKISGPFAAGVMYVIEGSKLGGKVIFKHILRTLKFSGNDGVKFIADHGVNTIEYWKEFLFNLSRYVVENDCEEEAIQGAEYAFRSIYNFFEKNRVVYEI